MLDIKGLTIIIGEIIKSKSTTNLITMSSVLYIAFLMHDLNNFVINEQVQRKKNTQHTEENRQVINLLSGNLIEKQVEKMSSTKKKEDIKKTDIKYVIELCHSPIEDNMQVFCKEFSKLLIDKKAQ